MRQQAAISSTLISIAPGFMPQRTLRFRIRPDGRVEERVEGVAGEACLKLTERDRKSVV